MGRALVLGTLVLAGPWIAPANAQGLLRRIAGPSLPPTGFAAVLVSAGDIDGDLVDEFYVGLPNTTFGNVSLEDLGGFIRSFEGASSQSRFGSSIAVLGDVDGDGRADPIIGAPNESGVGRASVFSVATGQLLWFHAGGTAGGRFGASVARIGDVNGDGVPDAAVGGPSDVGPGSVRILSGTNGALIREIPGGATNGDFGASVASAGDVNADGHADLLVGDPLDTAGTSGGSVTAFSGATGAVLFRVDGQNPGDRYGASLAGVGDVNGDGVADFATSGWNTYGTQAIGYVDALSGVNGARLQRFDFDLSDTRGARVSAIGDWNHDGRAEVAFSATGSDVYLPHTGSAFVWSVLENTILYRTHGLQPGLDHGLGLGGLGDVDGDGWVELGVGAPLGIGALYVHSSNPQVYSSAQGYCRLQPNSLGCTPGLDATGAPSATDPTPFPVTAEELPNNQIALLFYGYTGPSEAPFANGWLCVESFRFRSPPQQNTGGNPGPLDCSGTFDYDFNARVRSGLDPLLVPGRMLWAQLWYRDPGAAIPIGLTNALELVIRP